MQNKTVGELIEEAKIVEETKKNIKREDKKKTSSSPYKRAKKAIKRLRSRY